jgi:hypothetical protein
MSTRPWITLLLGRATPRATRWRRTDCLNTRRARLAVEVLEGRLAPAALTVNSPAATASNSDPYLSLPEAIRIVNSPTLPTDLSPQILGQVIGPLHGGGTDTIVFDSARVSGPIRLAGQLTLSVPARTTAVTIDGGGVVAMDGGNTTRLFQVDPGAQATIARLGIVRGEARPDEFSAGGGGCTTAAS